jgi:hypothetical protein
MYNDVQQLEHAATDGNLGQVIEAQKVKFHADKLA